MPKAPTNSDIVQLITLTHNETAKRLDGIQEQVTKTNGRVTELEKFRDEYDTERRVRKEIRIEGAEKVVVNRNFLLTPGGQKFLIGLGTLLGGIATIALLILGK